MNQEIKKVFLLDVFKMGDKLDKSESCSYRFVIRLPNENTFALIALGTGESVTYGSPQHIIKYLNGENPLHKAYEYHGNLSDFIKESSFFKGYGLNFAKIAL